MCKETYLRKALHHHDGMEISEFGTFFDGFKIVRLPYITMISHQQPTRSDHSRVRKTVGDLEIPIQDAKPWFLRFKQIGDIPYIGIEKNR